MQAGNLIAMAYKGSMGMIRRDLPGAGPGEAAKIGKSGKA